MTFFLCPGQLELSVVLWVLTYSTTAILIAGPEDEVVQLVACGQNILRVLISLQALNVYLFLVFCTDSSPFCTPSANTFILWYDRPLTQKDECVVLNPIQSKCVAIFHEKGCTHASLV